MLISSHLLGTLVLAKTLSLQGPDLYLALASGVCVDIDHFFVNKKWITDVVDYIKYRKITYGVNQHSWLQEYLFGSIIALFLGIIFSRLFFTKWWVLLVFLLLHISMDAVMKNEHKPFAPFSNFKYYGWVRSGSTQEIVISLAGLSLYFLFF